ncbi:MAG: FAD-dependent oxidoreductase [Candidatus Dormibacteria bacterium]
MADLGTIMLPLTGTVAPDALLRDVIPAIREHAPLPMFVGTPTNIEGCIDATGLLTGGQQSLVAGSVRDVMSDVILLDSGISIEEATRRLLDSTARAVVVTEKTAVFGGAVAPVGFVSTVQILARIGKNVMDKAPMKILSGKRDLGFNVPITPCQRNCPIHQEIATYIDYVSQGRYVDSWMVIHETNPFPSMLGRLCNHPCETDCKRGWDAGEEPVTIRSIKRFSTDYSYFQGLWIDYKIAPDKGKKVAIVGGGPSGLTAALDLRVQGYDVTIFEREGKVGGCLSTSIPPFRFDHKQLKWEIDMILATGITVKTNTPVGDGESEIHLDDLLREYDAVYTSVGLMKGRVLPVPGHNATQVTDAMTFLRTISYDRIPEHFPIDGRVVVVGGGAVATDACQSSIKLGAGEVWMCAIEPEDKLPAFGNELHEAKEIGLNIQCGILVKEILHDSEGNVKGVSFALLDELQFDSMTGKLIFASVKEKEGSERWTVDADYVIFASGQMMDAPGGTTPLSPRGLVSADRGGHTSVPKLFAGGDCVQGPSFIVDAMGWGHRVARSIREFLGERQEDLDGRLYQTIVERTDDHRKSEVFERTEPAILEAAKRYDMSECELPWSDEEAVVQAIRCFQCDTVHYYDESVCVLCGACDDVCPEKAIDVVVFGEDRERSSGGTTKVCETEVGLPDGGGVGGEIFINYDRCTNCRICEDHCPVNCITFERVRYIDDKMRVVERPQLAKTLPLMAV